MNRTLFRFHIHLLTGYIWLIHMVEGRIPMKKSKVFAKINIHWWAYCSHFIYVISARNVCIMNLPRSSTRLLGAYCKCVFAQQTYVNVIKFDNVSSVYGSCWQNSIFIDYLLFNRISYSSTVNGAIQFRCTTIFKVFVLKFESIDVY